ncbi:putative malic acid transport protein [Lachnellula suecica]|uniref:Putative malic acid transport protein n=1 Tax=Lachnellula suecica TaxID=602035 RepID=A0A8T9CFZ3_9HELO|nr:putative malic acid transport protein [Lachnellula suecica]
MSTQAGPIDELVQYKKAVLHDNRRDTHIRSDAQATLDFISNRKSTFFNNSDSRPAIHSRQPSVNSLVPVHMAYNQPVSISRPMMVSYEQPFSYNEDDNTNSFKLGKEKDIEVTAHAAPVHGHGAADHHHNPFGPVDPNLSWKGRLNHFTWANYTITMSTGGTAFVLSVIPHRFDGLTTLGTIMFVYNIGLFLIISSLITARFIIYPGTLKKSLSNPHEGFFFATMWLSFATMITNTTAYGVPNSGPWLIEALWVVFWVYTVCVTIMAIFYYHVLFTVHALVITNVLPGWILPIFPAMLVGTLASAIAKFQPAHRALPMVVTGLSFQGLGMMLAFMIYALYFGRMLTSGLPADASRPAMFIAVGPPAFTSLALIGMAQDVVVTKIFPNYIKLDGITDQSLIPDFFQLLALVIAISLWVFSFWAFGIAVVASIEAIGRNDFHLNWYAYIFPNVGFCIATIQIGNRLNSTAIKTVGTAMGGSLFFLLLVVYFCHAKAVMNKMIVWPGKDEDAH